MTHLILNVDDYRPSRYARTKVLQQAGFTVLEASTGQQTLDLIYEKKPALILLDVNLPDMSGFEICRVIKSNPETKGTPVLHISASSVQTSHQVHGLDGGADSYLVEPVDSAVLIATIKAFLRTSEAEDALRRSNQELEWFSSRVAHDLREPLRTITAHVQLLARRFPSEDASQSVEFVLDATRRMGDFIDNLLAYARLSHVDRESMTPLDCEASLSRALAALNEAISTSGAIVTHDSLPTLVSDPALDYVFQNLISNAIKYRRETVAPVIHVSAIRQPEAWQFSVQDNGMGIEPKYQEEIFKAFRRLQGTVAGNGLGLAVTQKIIQAQGGEVWVESTLGTGSTFYFTIPCSRKTV